MSVITLFRTADRQNVIAVLAAQAATTIAEDQPIIGFSGLNLTAGDDSTEVSVADAEADVILDRFKKDATKHGALLWLLQGGPTKADISLGDVVGSFDSDVDPDMFTGLEVDEDDEEEDE